jgi:hypothetical protein
MTAHPHDIADLYLAPVVLAVDARIEELSQLDPEALALRIALDSDLPDWTSQLRETGLLRAVGRLIDLHDWTISVDRRGIRLTHKQHSLALGMPQSLTDYLHAGRAAGSGTRA